MPSPPVVGKKTNGYEIIKHLNTGAMANAYAARNPEGQKVFLKWYKSPTIRVSWFEGWVKYLEELNRRVSEPSLKRFCVRHVDSFFCERAFHQVYEFVEGGHDLETILGQVRSNPSSMEWNKRTILAKVMMAGIHQLHDHKIAHCDLKPPNLQLLKDSSIEAGYQLKLIDMDFSVLSDRKAPWHGSAAYVGTPGYFSPEHLRGEVPGRESDVFTCGIILYELLAGGHPFPADTDLEYFEKVKAYKVSPPVLIGELDSSDATKALAMTIHRCLSPNASERPTAREVNLALNGRIGVPSPKKTEGTPLTKKPLSPPTPPKITKLEAKAISLTNRTGQSLAFNITTSLGIHLLRQLGEDAKYADAHQFTLERRGFEWWLTPQSGTVNYTFLNGNPVLIPVKLGDADLIELGSRTSGKRGMSLTVSIS
jgi:serine/threonine protein kinase